MGDFNHNIHKSLRSDRAVEWQNWIHRFWHDPIHSDKEYRNIPTFRNISTIAFLLVTTDLKYDVSRPAVQYVPHCDHSAVSINLRLGIRRSGPGIWRCNPYLVQDLRFRKELKSFCDAASRYIPDLDAPSQWDHFKIVLKGFIQAFSHKLHAKHRRKEAYLQRQRRELLRHQQHEHVADALSHAETQLDQMADFSASTLALRSGLRWREHGERSNSYFYKVIRARAQKQAIHELLPSEGYLVRSPNQLNNCAKQFYEQLYSPDPIDHEALEELLSQLPPSTCFDTATNNALTTEWTEEEVLACASKAPSHSSPGVDGIPYELLQLLLQHPSYIRLFTKVLNTTLKHSKFPATWQQSIVILLPKKGDRSQLKNWRPISLICVDAKIYTRLLATRVNGVLPHLIDIHQTGFMPNRFIADNGATTRLVMDVAQRMKLPGIALLLDQEKAYDRVHPQYLQACLDKFGFPPSLVASIISLFFGTNLCINVNGFLTAPIPQARGLRQGDPLSPLLFNLAIEPLLRAIWSSPYISGFTFLRLQQPNFTSLPRSSPPLKALAYADDVLVFLTRPTEMQRLLYLVSLYGKASNARLNRGKTLAVSLSGEDHHDWRQMLSANGITQWHDKRASSATIYLGYPLTSSAQQMSSYLDSLIVKLEKHATILSQRRLSILGRSMVANSLLLSRVWHNIRVLSPPQSFFQRLRTRPRNEGGIAVLDPSKQHSALQLRWLIPLLLPPDQATNPDSFAASLMKYTLCALSSAPSSVLPLLLPERRTTDLHKIGCFNSLFKTIDQMDFEINWMTLNASSAAEIPLSRICPLLLINDPVHTYNYWKSSLVKDLYRFSTVDGRLTPITSFLSRKQRNRSEAYFDLLSLGHIKEENFFTALRSTSDLSLGLFIFSMGCPRPAPEFHSLVSTSLPDGTSIENLSTKWFRHIDKLPLTSLSSHYPRASKSSWTLFWHASIPHPARTILWRLYHSKLPTRSRLHKLMPNTITDELCMLCDAIESDEHFLWSCPFKQPMWDTLLPRFFDQNSRLTFDEISRPNPISATVRAHWHLDSFQVVACGVLCLWRNHWKHVFDGSPFWPNECTSKGGTRINSSYSQAYGNWRFLKNN
ncbi:hypothetical protein G6F49_010411 [Rhizopus delemar]|nr:hypothetical protein G6F49_010411 [Rhizopus delemar]KAG1588557.1 hypothetical protein G6F48_005193 [Rhizopus delemar]KAG1641910.1 hypothetical protein G6F44_005353 [Rhizopus delemar]